MSDSTSASASTIVKPKFSGHETFPLRQLWLPKFTALVSELQAGGRSTLPSDEECIVRLGVGKNMVSSMRFWSEAAGMVRPDRLELTPLGRFIFCEDEMSEEGRKEGRN